MFSYLALEGYHVFITGAASGVGNAAVQEFLNLGCRVTAHDLCPLPFSSNPNLHTVSGDISDESSISSSIDSANATFGPINILIANAGICQPSSGPIWKIPLSAWEKTYNNNIRGTFLTIKTFLQAAESQQLSSGQEIENLAIVVTGSETGKFGYEGFTEYASGKAGLQYGLVRGVKNEIVRLNSKARINAVAPGWIQTPMIGDHLDDPRKMWEEVQSTSALCKVAQPEDVARTMAFLASHRAAGHITGECVSVDGGMEGRLLWSETQVLGTGAGTTIKKAAGTAEDIMAKSGALLPVSILTPLSPAPQRKIQILLSIDFDAVSGWLGTGAHEDNNMADYSSGYFAAQVGVPRLLRLFKRLDIADKVTWFIPGHSMESFPKETKAIVDSGAEIGCHGYAHEGAAQMTEEQEADVVARCVELATQLTGKKPKGWRAPLYQLREHTVQLLESHGFLYDTSLTHHDSQPYFLLSHPKITPISFTPETKASAWMHPLPAPSPRVATTLVEIPCNWYMEDMTPMQYLPHAANSHGYVSPESMETTWRDRFDFLYREMLEKEEAGESEGGFVFPLVLHPDTSGMAHIITMIERIVKWLKERGEFVTFGECVVEWKGKSVG